MKIPRPTHKSVLALTQRWEVPAHAIVDWAADGHFELSARLPPVCCGEEKLSGVVDIDPSEVYPLFRMTEPDEAVVIRRVSQRLQWRDITAPAEGARLRRGDVIVAINHVERFELVSGLLNATIEDLLEHVRQQERAKLEEREPDERGQRGARDRYDWDAMWAEVVRRIHDEGVPERREELVRDVQEWFAARDQSAVPDASWIRRKLRPVWQALQPA